MASRRPSTTDGKPRKATPAKKAAPAKPTRKASTTKRATAPSEPARPGRPTRITDDLIRLIAAGVGAGMFPHVAARAAGVHRSLYHRWMNRGEAALALEADGKPIPAAERPYAEFCAMVGQEAARARGEAEAQTRKESPAQWLRWGPGRDRGPDDPGWTNAITLASPDGGPLPTSAPAAVVVQVQYVDDLDGTTD